LFLNAYPFVPQCLSLCPESKGFCAVTCGRILLQNGTIAKYEQAMHIQNTVTDM